VAKFRPMIELAPSKVAFDDHLNTSTWQIKVNMQHMIYRSHSISN